MNHEFRCPVCGHAGQVSLPEEGTARVGCENCGTVLVVKETDPGSLVADARVANGTGPPPSRDDGGDGG